MKNIAESTWYGIGSFLPYVLFLVTVVVTCVLLHEDAMMPLCGIPLAAAALLAVILFWFYVITMSMDAERLSDSRTRYVWMLLLWMANILVFPFYWFVCIKNRNSQSK